MTTTSVLMILLSIATVSTYAYLLYRHALRAYVRPRLLRQGRGAYYPETYVLVDNSARRLED